MSTTILDGMLESFDMGNGYGYYRRDIFDIEIRHFALELHGDIDEQIRLIEKYNINGLAFVREYSATPEVQETECRMAYNILEQIGHRLLSLDLTSFEIFETLDILDFTPNLKRLWLYCKLKKPYDFSKLPNLIDLTVWYSKAFSNIFECTGIRKLIILKMDAYAAENIGKLSQLEELWIQQSSIKSLAGLKDLSGIERLHLRWLPKLESISFLETYKNLKKLHLQNCKNVADWEVIGSLSALKGFCLENCGTLNDILFLKPLENLEVVHFIGPRFKLLDGNVRWLYEKPNMKKISIYSWNKDWNITLEELWAGQSPERYPDVWKWNLQ